MRIISRDILISYFILYFEIYIQKKNYIILLPYVKLQLLSRQKINKLNRRKLAAGPNKYLPSENCD